MSTLILRSITVTMLAAALFTGCSYSPTSVKAAVKPEKERKLAPNFALKNATGQTVKLSDYRGKVVVLNFWATWCGPCKVEIPWFVDFQQTYKDKNFTVLGVSMDDDGWKAVTPYLAEHKLNYPVVIGSEEVSQQYGGIEALPTTFVIDQEGRIASIHQGLISKSEYENEIRNLLDKDPSKGNLRASLNE
ncbi:MAG: TlpA disulfide reductase family protein [Bryobacteraceae bacterium]